MRKRNSWAFTIIELLVVISIIALLIALLLPSLAGARDRARFIKWAAYSNSLRSDTRMISYFNYENQNTTDFFIRNQAAGNPNDLAKEAVEPEDMNAQFGSVSGPTAFKKAPFGDDNIAGNADDPARYPKWREGRWKGKGAVKTIGNATDPDVARARYNALYGAMDRGTSFGCWMSTDRAGGIDGEQNFRVFERGNAYFIRQVAGSGTAMSVSALPWNFSPVGSNTAQYNANATGVSTFAQGQWYFIVATFTPTNPNGSGDLKCYVDGKLRSTNSMPIKPRGKEYEENVWFHSDDAFGDGFDGVIDEFLVMNSPMDVVEIETQFRVGKPRDRR